jgi:hypothetical protein
MSDAATTAAPAVPMSDVTSTPTFDGPAAVAARAEIETLKADKDFYNKLMQKDPGAHQRWSDLHKAGWPAAQQIASAEDVQSQADARGQEQWNKHDIWQKQTFGLDDTQLAGIRRGECTHEQRDWALRTKDALLKDKAWLLLHKHGDANVVNLWGRVTNMLRLRVID